MNKHIETLINILNERNGYNSKIRRGNPDDEFYTRYEDADKELRHYIDKFRNKIIYCNCDNPEWSLMYAWLKNNFEKCGIKKIYATYYGENTPITIYDGIEEKQIPNKGNGSFDSPSSLRILQECDIVVSNPPFGPLVILFIELLLKYNKDFISVVPLTVISKDNIIKGFNSGKLYRGFSYINKFKRPDNTYKDAAVFWLTSYPNQIRDFNRGNKEKVIPYFVTVNNKFMLNVDRVCDIPEQFDYELLVPLSFVRVITDRYKILGYTRNVLINGKTLAGRILIKLNKLIN